MSDVHFLSLFNSRIAYRLYENKDATTDRHCLLLHGAGVAGEITYSPILPYFTNWRWLLVPDIKGMGESFHLHGKEAPVTISELTHDIEALLVHLNWQDFDVVGYSLGGLIALNLNHRRVISGHLPVKMALMEPASLDREDLNALSEVRKKYRQASSIIRETGDVEQGVAHFMDGVSPNRRKHPVAEATTQSRLAHRPHGFSYALDAVTNHVDVLAQAPEHRDAMIRSAKEVFLFSGELSSEQLREHYQKLSEQFPGWQHKVMSACDHSLPFQKPRQIANHINRWFALN
ncbi:alpha/beta hydrolase [Marinomonas arenicola]|uniref:Alpha/beta hydrolase n=1 Tax=Marinomonas arenicola TaxID=569601 RepID=A0ABU9G5J2_9GAMM